jgi:Zn-dependent peptidase ImmA (M78 family)/transcriptional regulator with XRE-family HTH domain
MNRTINSAMIVLARESHGLTQSELAKRIDVPQSTLSKMESGQIDVPSNVLAALAKELKYPEKFFFQTFEVYPAGMHLYLYRKHKTLPAKDLSRITALMNIYRSHVKYLLNAAEVEYKPVPEHDIDEFGSIAEIARAVRQQAGLPSGPIENLTTVLEDMGIVVVPFNPGTRMFAGASMLSEKPNYVVVANSQMPGDRWRWTLAHELGHMVMHHTPTANMEAEADEFAAEFLMPSREISQYLTDLNVGQLASLKRYWKVSMFAILSHARRLGCISERQQRTLIMKLAKAHITRTKEPPELNIPRETPTLLNELIEFHDKELRYDVEQLADLLNINVRDLNQKYNFTGRNIRLVRNVG